MRRQDSFERDELVRRLNEKDRISKDKPIKHNISGVQLSEEDKARILPHLKLQSRMRFLDKREKEQLEQATALLED